MLTHQDTQMILSLVENVVQHTLEPINDQAKVHLEFHKQLAERITRLEERIESTNHQEGNKA